MYIQIISGKIDDWKFFKFCCFFEEFYWNLKFFGVVINFGRIYCLSNFDLFINCLCVFYSL